MLCLAGDESINPCHLQLIKWTNKEGNISRLKLYNEMAPHWKDVAELIGVETEIIGLNHHHDVRECIREVMKEWMSDKPNITTYLCTWKGLCELLDDVGLGKASENLQEACSSHHCET